MNTRHSLATLTILTGLTAFALPGADAQQYKLTTLIDFAGPNGANPTAAPTVAADGTLYGTTKSGGGSGKTGVLYSYKNGVFNTLYAFPNVNNQVVQPHQVAIGPGGALSGVTSTGGTGGVAPGDGELYSYQNGSFTPRHDFYRYTEGLVPYGPPAFGPGGLIYGTTSQGGQNSKGGGTVYSLDPANNAVNVLYQFNSNDNTDPRGSVTGITVGPGGTLYGTTSNGGGSQLGTVFSLNSDGTGCTTLVSFTGTGGNGANPSGELTVGPDGTVYGTAGGGGAFGRGLVFSIHNGTFTDLHDFNVTDGAAPKSALTLGPDGTLYGTTYGGGQPGPGTVFALKGTTFRTLYSFSGSDGMFLYGGLALDPNGTLYGTTYQGGANNLGTLFALTPSPEPTSVTVLALGASTLGVTALLPRTRRKRQRSLVSND